MLLTSTNIRSGSRRQLEYICRQCLHKRGQSTTPPRTGPPSASSSSRPDPRQQLLLQQLQESTRAVPDYPQAKSAPKKRPGEQHSYDAGPFHPAFIGFVAGAMVAAGGLYIQYYLNGSKRIVDHHKVLHERINDDRQRLFIKPGKTAPGAVAGTLDERLQWFQRCTLYYAAYTPNSVKYAESVLPDITALRALGSEATDKDLDEIVIDCANKLQALIKGGEMGLSVGASAWEIMHEHLEQIAELADERRHLPQGIRDKVQKRLEELAKIGSKVGRLERRAMEDEELKKAA